MPGMGITNDGTQGRKQFYEARGYTVTTCYNQPTDNKYAGGFSYAQFRAEIDAGRPVMLNLNGHTIVGVGYNDPSTVYIHDTWHQDGTNQSMTWGGSFGGMDLLSVSIVNLAPNNPPNAFHFTDRLAVALNTEYKSNAITVTGITKATPISIVGGRYSINGGAYTTASGTVRLGNTVKVRKMSSSNYGTWKNATLTIGEASDIFSVMTHYEGSADPFTFTNITNAALNTEYTSNVVYLTGFYIPTTLSGTPASVVIVPPPAPHMCHVRYFGVFCADGECEYSRPDNGNDYWTNVYMTNFTCWQGTWVKVRMMSPGTYSTTKTMVLQAGDDQSGTFSVTTMAPP